MSEKIVNDVINNPRLLSSLAEKVYERLRDDVIIKKLEENSEAIKSMQEEVKKHGEAIEKLEQAVIKQGEAIQKLQLTVDEHSKAIKRLGWEIKRLSVEVGSFTNRAGKGMEKTMLKLYKKALQLHDVDPTKVQHGLIVDDVGIIEKGKAFEVDFYETNDYVYVFEIKNFADEGALEQIIIRKKLFSAKYKDKKLKLFLIANFVDKKVRKPLKEEGVEIIASHVV
ncbi:hypothetical protein HS7_11860 [Sulfolobales archaeon HS-7]|nr:hypothetical protein HS7_11860 [Sulfolobales archaeon HS-7]